MSITSRSLGNGDPKKKPIKRASSTQKKRAKASRKASSPKASAKKSSKATSHVKHAAAKNKNASPKICRVSTEEEFATAVECGEEEIEVVGKYADKVAQIASLSPGKWALVIGGLGTAVGLAPFTGGLTLTAGLLPMGLGLGGLGLSITIGALVAIGGVTLLNGIRKYKIIKRGHDRIVLRKKA